MGSTQAELAGRTEGPSLSPGRGQLLQNFTLPSTSGHPISVSEYHGERNLVLLFMTHDTALLRALSANYPALRDEQAEVLVIVEGSGEDAAKISREFNLPFPVLMDGDGSAHRRAGSDAKHPALYIVDRFGEVFGAFREREGSKIPSIAEIIEQVRFINIQCDECSHPEWPVV